jgi:hypothetical protein
MLCGATCGRTEQRYAVDGIESRMFRFSARFGSTNALQAMRTSCASWYVDQSTDPAHRCTNSRTAMSCSPWTGTIRERWQRSQIVVPVHVRDDQPYLTYGREFSVGHEASIRPFLSSNGWHSVTSAIIAVAGASGERNGSMISEPLTRVPSTSAGSTNC